MSSGDLKLALMRFADMVSQHGADKAAVALQSTLASLEADAGAAVEEHARKNQFVHGIGPNYVAKTRNASQYPDWNEIQNKPDFPGLDPESLRLSADQIVDGVFDPNRLPLAAPGEVTYDKLVRANDPRLGTQIIAGTTSEFVAAGDWVNTHEVAGNVYIRRADATQSGAGGAIGYVAEAAGIGESVEVYHYGENSWCVLPGASLADLGRVVYLSTTPGKVSFTPPSQAGQLIQPLGTVAGITQTGVLVLVRYEFRFRL